MTSPLMLINSPVAGHVVRDENAGSATMGGDHGGCRWTGDRDPAAGRGGCVGLGGGGVRARGAETRRAGAADRHAGVVRHDHGGQRASRTRRWTRSTRRRWRCRPAARAPGDVADDRDAAAVTPEVNHALMSTGDLGASLETAVARATSRSPTC